MTTGLAIRSVGKPVKKNQHVRPKTGGTVAQQLPEYLLPDQVDALMKQAPNAQSEVLMLTQWRAGLRISEALGLEVGDLALADDGGNATLYQRSLGLGSGSRGYGTFYVKSLKLVCFALLNPQPSRDRLLGSIIMPEVFAGVRSPGCHLSDLWHEGQRQAIF